MNKIPRMPADSFTAERWYLGSQIWIDLGFHASTGLAKDVAPHFADKVVGYREGDKLTVRPKYGTMAILIWFDEYDDYGWTHVTEEEFYEIEKCK